MRKFLSSVKLSVVLLLILAALSILGTVIPQGQPPSEYVKMYGESVARVVTYLQLNDMYHSLWFRALLLLFALNLIFCSAQRLPGVIEALRKRKLLGLEEIKKFQVRFSAKKEKLEDLKKEFGTPSLSQDGKYLFEKGRLSPLGPYITHFGILIILIGGLIGSFFGVRGSVNIPEGESRSFIFVRRGDRVLRYKLPFSIKCLDFSIDYYKGSMVPKEYRSQVEIVSSNGTVIKKGTIRVNHPLKVMGYTIYQASYGRMATGDYIVDVYSKDGKKVKELELKQGEKVEFLPGKEIKVAFFQPNLQGFGEAVHMVYYENGVPKDAFWLLLRFPNFDKMRGKDYYFVLKDIKSKFYTGLEVSRSPGVNLVWLGCVVMSLGIFISFFLSHRRVWVVEEGGKIHVAGVSNKNQEGFYEDLKRILGVKG